MWSGFVILRNVAVGYSAMVVFHAHEDVVYVTPVDQELLTKQQSCP